MTTPSSEELTPLARELLRQEQLRPSASAEAEDAVLSRLEKTLQLPPEVPGGDAGATAPSTAGAGAGVASSAGVSKFLAVFVAGAVVGGSSVLAVQQLTASEPPSVSEVARVTAPAPAAPPSPAPVAAAPSTDTAAQRPIAPESPPVMERRRPARKTPEEPRPATEPSAEVSGPETAPSAESTLDSERRLLERARVALGRGRPSEALEAVERHEREFPAGHLAEERESLWIQALVHLNAPAEAKARAAAFHQKYPRSILGPAVDAVLRSIP